MVDWETSWEKLKVYFAAGGKVDESQGNLVLAQNGDNAGKMKHRVKKLHVELSHQKFQVYRLFVN